MRCWAALVLALMLAGCGTAAPRLRASVLLLRSGPAPALAALPGGGLLVGAQDGRITALRGGRASHPFPRLRVSRGGQRGLLGLAVLRGRVYAAWTDARRRLVVGLLRRGASPRLRWVGPRTATLANGGHLVAGPHGMLVIGIGDLQRGAQRGRLLGLDPAGPAGQRPLVLSRGWNNPFAFTYDGPRLWVADNSPGRAPERLARGDGGVPRDVTVLGRKTAPSGLVAIGGGALAVCGFVSGALDRYVLDGSGHRLAGTIASGCRYGAVRLSDGRVAFATGTEIRAVVP